VLLTPFPAPGAIFAGDYRIERPLGQGGMGAVFVATQLRTQKQRALKLLKPELVSDAKVRARFVDEARLGARIASEHIVEVIDAGMDAESGTPWLAMELLEGEDLAKRVERAGPLSPIELLALVPQLGHALGAAHAAGIVHRDLKPENLFVARTQRHDGAQMLKVLDFGIAKLLPEHRTAATVTGAMGSPLYWSPEQTRAGSLIRPTSDVWSLGLVAFFLLTGRSYWRTAHVAVPSIGELVVELMIDPLVPASARAAELGAGASLGTTFDGWFASCVVRDPAQRFRDGAVACTALASVLRAMPNVRSAPSHAAAFAATLPAAVPAPAAQGAPSLPSTLAMAPSAPPATPAPSAAVAPTPDEARGRSRAPWALVGALSVLIALGSGVLGTWLVIGRRTDPPPALAPTLAMSLDAGVGGDDAAVSALAAIDPAVEPLEAHEHAHAHAHAHTDALVITPVAPTPTATTPTATTPAAPPPMASPPPTSPTAAPTPPPLTIPIAPPPAPVAAPAPAPPAPPAPTTCLEALQAAGRPSHESMFCDGANDRCAVALLARGHDSSELIFCRGADGACAEQVLRSGASTNELIRCQ
jgi:tRNA A-37 threonylcarbamoyl transferase component Bud32